ncbi:hypothetical protein P7C70_g1488, partial [Phenoliferia sp. Uapishka_3]
MRISTLLGHHSANHSRSSPHLHSSPRNSESAAPAPVIRRGRRPSDMPEEGRKAADAAAREKRKVRQQKSKSRIRAGLKKERSKVMAGVEEASWACPSCGLELSLVGGIQPSHEGSLQCLERQSQATATAVLNSSSSFASTSFPSDFTYDQNPFDSAYDIPLLPYRGPDP